MQQSNGKVWLVGAGPGDPGLLTLKGARLLAQADVVVYDYLANTRLLEHCPNAQKMYVGKKAASHTLTQEQINALLVEQGLAGKKVVRLKGGDPFIFGRGGEECLALRDAGVAFEVVPGITAAIGGPAYAGIPVTHRDFNSSFTFITGHEKEEDYKDDQAKARGAAVGSSDLDWASIAKLPCMAFYMGVKALPRICSKLIEHGMDPNTPAATIRWGTRPQQQTVAATVGTLVSAVEAAQLKPPALTIIGKVVSLREQLNWFETRPLFGKTIVVTRTRQQASDLTIQLEELGAHVIEAPTIQTKLPENPAALDDAIRSAGEYDWVVFTSPNGVAATKSRMVSGRIDVRCFAGAKIAVVGQATADAVFEQLGMTADVCPQRSVAEALADALETAGAAGKRYLLLRADIARPVLRDRLLAAGAAAADDVPVYETVLADALPEALIEALDAREVDAITFTSSSTAKNLATLLGPNYRDTLAGIQIISIGPITSAALRELGLPPDVEAREFNLHGLVDAVSGGQL